jgi:hypothetical protein
MLMAGIKVFEYSITTKLSVKNVAFIFREHIVKADKMFFRALESQSKDQWEFHAPEKATDAFADLVESGGPEATFQVIAHSSTPPAGSGVFQQALAVRNQFDIVLSIWDQGTDRRVTVGAGESSLIRSHVANFVNHLQGADPGMQVKESGGVL